MILNPELIKLKSDNLSIQTLKTTTTNFVEHKTPETKLKLITN